jgi:hypothetical protein
MRYKSVHVKNLSRKLLSSTQSSRYNRNVKAKLVHNWQTVPSAARNPETP